MVERGMHSYIERNKSCLQELTFDLVTINQSSVRMQLQTPLLTLSQCTPPGQSRLKTKMFES